VTTFDDVTNAVRGRLPEMDEPTARVVGAMSLLRAERDLARAERDAARDLAVRLEGMLGRVEDLHPPRVEGGWGKVPVGSCLECEREHPCPTWLLAHYGDAL